MAFPQEAPVEADVTLIDAMLALSPEEHLRENDRMIRTIEELRLGFAAVIEETLRRSREP